MAKSKPDQVHQAHCVKCKTKRDMHDHQYDKTSHGRHMVRGVCPHCGTKMVLFINGDKLEKIEEEKTKK